MPAKGFYPNILFFVIHDIHDLIFFTEASEITGTSGKITKDY